MMKKSVVILLSLFVFLSCNILQYGKTNKSLISPDGKIEIRFNLAQEAPTYSVQAFLKPLLLPSKMGFIFADGSHLQNNFKIDKMETTVHDTSWQPVWGTDKNIRDRYNKLVVHLSEKDSLKRKLIIEFRAYNDGIAFRYLFPKQANLTDFKISDELTEFNLSADFNSWWIERDIDSYEKLFQSTPVSKIIATQTPLTCKAESGIHLSIHEAALTDYASMTLVNKDSSTLLECDLVPWPDGVKVVAKAPFKSPWRTIQIAENAGELLESHLIENLNEPCKIEDTSWIKPMKYVGIWWGMHIGKYSWVMDKKHGANTANAKHYIDYAAKNNIGGVLIEGWNVGWETWGKGLNIQNYTKPYPDFDLPYLAKYAQSKGVSIIGHHESGANVTEYESQMPGAMQYYKSLGMHAVKTGYVGPIIPQGQHHHGQWMVNHYRRVVQEAAKNQIMVDVHEPIKPTGIRRTWPNMMTREGVRGMEYNAWSDGNPPEHTTILPFTRMLAGPLDYTPGIFNLKFDDTGKHRVYTTLAKQLALYVVLYSPLQMAADLIENYENQPAFQFIRDVPVNWDESRTINAEIGDFVTVARRSGNDWYVGGITDENPRQMEIPLDFLDADKVYNCVLYRDAEDTDYENNPQKIQIEKLELNANDILKIDLKKSGGFAAQFVAID